MVLAEVGNVKASKIPKTNISIAQVEFDTAK
jgi:hypothetical protein